MPGASRLAEFGTDDAGRAGEPDVAAAAGSDHRDRRRDGEQVVQGQLLEGRHGVHPAGGVDVEVDADEVVRGPAAGDSVAGGPGGGGEEGAYGGGVGGGVVDAVAGETAGAAARDRPVLVVVGRAQGGELGGGQRDDGEPRSAAESAWARARVAVCRSVMAIALCSYNCSKKGRGGGGERRATVGWGRIGCCGSGGWKGGKCAETLFLLGARDCVVPGVCAGV